MKSRKDSSALKEEKGICYQWKEKGQCSKGDRCSFPPHTSATPSEPAVPRGRSVSRKRSIRGKSKNGSILRQTSTWEVFVRERLVSIGIRPSANSIKMKRVVRLETSVSFRITRLMNNQIKSRKRATSQKEEKATTRMLWLLWKVYHNLVLYHKIQMHSFLKVESLGETRCRKSWHQFKGYDSRSLRYVRRVSGNRKDHRWAGPAVKNHISSEMARDLIAIYPTMYVLVHQRVLPRLHFHPFLHHLHHRIPYLMSTDTQKIRCKKEVEVRVKSFGRDPLHESTETENKNKNEERDEVQREKSHELPDWLQGFRESLVDESTSTKPWRNPEQGSRNTSKSSRELPMEPRAKVPGSCEHSVYTHFLKDPKCDICLETKKKGFLQKTCWHSRAQRGTFWWLDYCRSQNSQWKLWTSKQSSWCRTWPPNGSSRIRAKQKLLRKHTKELAKLPGAREETKSHLYWQFLGIGQSLWRSFLESLYVNTTQIGNKWDCWKSSAQSKRRDICGAIAVRSG